METRARCLAGIVLAVLMLASRAPAADNVDPRPQDAKPAIEVAFVLDTTGSMSGLIQAAKDKIWAIANTLATTKPAPDIKIGLVGYRDRGDAYITRVTGLNDDLDAVYKELIGFQANGGGDGPESVNQALHEALTKLEWSTDDKTYRVIFLVGDWPPHMDYANDIKYPVTCEKAAKAGIVINTIQCGNYTGTVQAWRDIAARAEGQYFRVEQSGGAIVASTPFDADLAKLSAELDKTRIYYGSTKERAESKEREKVAAAVTEAASDTAAAQRAVFNASVAGRKNFAGKQELVNDMKDGTVALDKLTKDELPGELRDLSDKERKAYVAKMAERRKQIQAEIAELGKKRQAHIAKKVEEQRLEDKGGLDFAIYGAIKEQAAKRDIEYTDGPAY